MTDRYDVLIIGAGHNGLVCAAYLAKAGKKVLVLERSDQVGGAAITREFAKGFKVSACAHILQMLQPKIIKDLKLKDHGLEVGGPELETISLTGEGNIIKIGRDSVLGVSDGDREAYEKFMKRMTRLGGALSPQLLKTPLRLASVGFENSMKLASMGYDMRFGLGKKRMQDLMRIIGMNIHDLLDEVFEDEGLKAALSLDAVMGTAMEPRMPGTVLTYLYRLAGGLNNPMTLPLGGMGGVTETLAKAATYFGAEIKTKTPVENILLENGIAVGMTLKGGSTLHAPTIISNADPKTTFLKLVGARNLEAGFANRIGNFRAKGRAAKVHVALNGLPDFKGLDQKALGQRLVIAPTRKYLEQAFNHSKYGEFSKAPALEITIPTLADPTLAPKGCHVLSAVVHYAPTELKGGWKKQKEAFIKSVVGVLSTQAPDFKDKMTAIECLTPPDLESEFGMTGGHWHHGELALDQIFMMRPTYGAAQYQTPVDGLFLCGAGSHPGGGVSGAAGHNAAEAVLRGTK